MRYRQLILKSYVPFLCSSFNPSLSHCLSECTFDYANPKRLPNPNLKLLIRSLCQQSYHFRVLPKMYEISSDQIVMTAMASYVRARGRRWTPTLPIKSAAGREGGMTVWREPFGLYQCRYTRKAVTSYSGLCKYKIEQ